MEEIMMVIITQRFNEWRNPFRRPINIVQFNNKTMMRSLN